MALLLFAWQTDIFRLPLGMAALALLWIFFLGGCIGSFMNVVIYRLPAGLSVVTPASRCPRCGKAIRWYDNLPMLSWLLLRARCRDCGLPIPARYPLVELLVALLFVALAASIFLEGGPWWLANHMKSPLHSYSWPKLAGMFAFYQVLLCTLVCAAFIAWDGHRVPRRLLALATLTAVVAPVLWTNVRPFLLAGNGFTSPDALEASLTQGFLGALLGLGLGLLYDLVRGLQNSRGEPRGRLLMPAGVIGLALGWEVIAVAMTTGSVVALVWPLIMGRSPETRERARLAAPLAGFTATTAALVIAGGSLKRFRGQLDAWQVLAVWLAAAAIVATAAWLARRLHREPEPISSAPSEETVFP